LSVSHSLNVCFNTGQIFRQTRRMCLETIKRRATRTVTQGRRVGVDAVTRE
jgi:hypothetical protein